MFQLQVSTDTNSNKPPWSLNTSHVSVTVMPPLKLSFTSLEFKYISCFSYSKLQVLTCCTAIPFKYISCFSYSVTNTQGVCKFILFKYISCFSYRRQILTLRHVNNSLNTSHVSVTGTTECSPTSA